MSLHFVIDAYNLIRRTSIAGNQNQIKGLVDFIIQQRPQGSLENKVTLVFDGFCPRDTVLSKTSNLKIIFAQDKSADDVIKAIAKATKNKNLIVVTDDREIIDSVKLYYVKAIATTQFFNQAKRFKAKRQAKPDSGSDKNLSYTQIQNINKELEDIWLKKKK